MVGWARWLGWEIVMFCEGVAKFSGCLSVVIWDRQPEKGMEWRWLVANSLLNRVWLIYQDVNVGELPMLHWGGFQAAFGNI